jgi:hypothetical protein
MREPVKLPPEIEALNDAIYENLRIARALENRLLSLSSAFSMTGNTQLAEELAVLSGWALEAAQRVRDAHSDDGSRQLRESQESSGMLLKAVLAGAFATPEERAARKTQDVVRPVE